MNIRTTLRSFTFLAAFGLVIGGLGIQPVLGRNAAPDAPLPPVTTVGVTGTLEVAHFDDFVRGHRHLYWLKTTSARIPLKFANDDGQYYGGDPVSITGEVVGDTIAVEDMKVLPLAAPAGEPVPGDGRVVAAAQTAKNVAVILVNFTNDTSQPITTAAASAAMFTNTGSVKNFFQEESRGSVSLSGQVFGWYTIPDTNDGCDWSTWGSEAQTAAQNAGVNLSAYTNIVFAWPGASSCGWAGLAYVPGTLTYNNGSFDLRVLAHELSHNFGIMHASSLTCTSGSVRVSFSATCTYSEYGDPFTVMGGGSTYHNAGLQIGQMGWLSPGEVQTVVPTSTPQTYQVGPLLATGAVKELKVARGDGSFFYLDYRATIGTTFDKFAPGSPAVSGVTIRLSSDQAVPGGSTHNTMLIDTTASTTTFTDAPLLVGQTFTDPVKGVSITTVSAGAVATVSITSNSSTTAPGSPVLTAATPGNGSVALTWNAPSNNGGSSITGYNVYRGTTTGSESLLTTLGNVTSWSNTALTNGQAYFYEVAAINGVGPGTLSNELSATPTGPTAPGQPTLTGATPGNGSVALTWTAPASTGGAEITNYKVWRSTAAGQELLFATLGNVTSYTNTSLTNGQIYYYKVSAFNGTADSVLSNEMSATPVNPVAAPAAPALTAATPGNASVALTWSAPSATGGSPITAYKVYRGASATSTVLVATLGNVTSWTNTGLTNGQAYFFQVTASNGLESAKSNALSATPSSGATVPGVPSLTAAAGNGTIALTWTAPAANGSAIVNYNIYRRVGAGAAVTTPFATLGTATSWTDTGLTNGQTYSYRVSAINGVGEGAQSGELSATPTGPLPPPGNIAFVKTVATGSVSKAGNATLSITPTGSVAAGNWVIVAVTVGTFGGAVGCSDTKGNHYTVDADVSSVGRQFVCSARINTALTTSDSITATYPGFSGMTAAIASEYSGVTGVDQQRSATGNGGTLTSGPVTTTYPNELLFAAFSHSGTPTLTAGCGFTASGGVAAGFGGGQKSIDTAYQLASAAGTYSACATIPAGHWWTTAIVTYH